MSKGVNKVILVGNCGQDPDTKFTAVGAAITNISVATSESWKDKQTGQLQERTEWHKVVFFGRLAEIVGEYARKGSKVYIEGQLRTRKWQNKEGADQYTTEIVAGEIQLLDSKGGAVSNSNNQPQQPQQAPQQQAQYQPQKQNQYSQQTGGAPQQQNQYSQQQQPDDFKDDDIPFD